MDLRRPGSAARHGRRGPRWPRFGVGAAAWNVAFAFFGLLGLGDLVVSLRSACDDMNRPLPDQTAATSEDPDDSDDRGRSLRQRSAGCYRRRRTGCQRSR